MIEVIEVNALSLRDLEQLSGIVIGVVQAGASVGWVAPPSNEEAVVYWEGVIRPGNLLLLARDGETIVGTAQLELAQKANGAHRAEVNKVLVDPGHQRRGIGLLLMSALDDLASKNNRTLLHLDTNSDDVAIGLYLKAGYTRVGEIPDFATAPSDGHLHGTTFFYKQLTHP